ncbi:F-box domain containing protein [Trema orientale]|uniref:F-box domain containing protein n=1 Tax=Trema orientale TaxID=63057 RepID=A0A2P5BJF6_TREOI|nr:F-box domain containing protein [Trema orientale]
MEVQKGSHSLSEDIMIKIMSKLPVKSLLRFKCVSKQWFSLITTDSYFITTQLHHSSTSKLCILYGDEYKHQEKETIYVDRMLLIRDQSTVEDLHLDHHPPVDQRFEIVGSCNGLVCVRLLDSPPGYTNIVLWNPATKDSRYLPEPMSLQGKKDSKNIMSFGFDHHSKDYKLVIFELNNYKDWVGTMFRFQVFRKSSNSWSQTLVNDLSSGYKYKLVAGDITDSVILNGILYLFGHESSDNDTSYTIFSFSLTNEKFDEKINLPPSKCSKDKFSLTNSWKDSLCLMESDAQYYHLWVRGDKCPTTQRYSWTKLFNVQHIISGAYLLYFTGVWKNGFLFGKYENIPDPNSGELILIDLNHYETKLKKIGGYVILFKAFDYVESLVSVYPSI